jgi:tetratricopeptide (TPR) repeat protein
MTSFPWSELGLDGPADERTIRRAYASRLKIVRPDVDAAGFQRLVEARDMALRTIQHTALRPLARPTAPANPVTKSEDPPPPEGGAPPPDSPDKSEVRPQAPRFLIDLGASNGTVDAEEPKVTPPADMPGPVEVELSTGSRSLPAASKPPPSQQPRLVTADVDPPKPPPTVTEPDAKPPGAKQVAANQAQPPEPAGPDAVLTLLSAFVDAWRRNLVLPPVAPILKLLSEQSIVARQKLEIEALRAAAALFEGLFDGKTPAARRTAAKSLIIALDDDYAWTKSDRRLYMMLPQATADQIGRLLRAARQEKEIVLTPTLAPPRQQRTAGNGRWIGVSVLVLLSVIVRTVMWNATHWQPPSIRTTATPTFSQIYPSVSLPNPSHVISSFDRGVLYDNKGQFDEAIREYDLAIRLNPKNALAHYNRGLDYANKGQFDRAIEDYDQTISLNPDNPDNFVSRGAAYDGKGQYDRAIEDYDQAIRLKPDYGLAFVDRGIAYANKGEYDRAIQDYDQAIRIDPNDSDALNNRDQAKQAKGEITGREADTARAK